jgi:hypothetical protein
MSFRLFEEGYTPQEIKRFKEQRREREREQAEQQARDEAEPMLAMLRFLDGHQNDWAHLRDPETSPPGGYRSLKDLKR